MKKKKVAPMDLRKIAAESALMKQPLWVERWKCWVAIQELTGGERAELIDKCTKLGKDANGKRTSKVDLKLLYPLMVVWSIRYPGADSIPDSTHPHYNEYPGVNGNPPEPKAGELAFTTDDILMLNSGSGNLLETLSKPASIMSGLREEDIDEKKETLDEKSTVQSDGYTIE